MHSLGIVQWNSTRRDHPGNLGGVSGSGPVISPSICMHKILLEDNANTSIEHKKRLNPVMKEVVRKEVLK